VGRFLKGHKINLGRYKVKKLCKRCGLHGISSRNTKGICAQCSKEVWDKHRPLPKNRETSLRDKTVIPLERAEMALRGTNTP